jgi:hypothetical protein
MTESSLDPEVIKKTQELLGKFVKKPPLTEKLLKKPPFKFIHDVVKVVSVEILRHHQALYRSNRKICYFRFHRIREIDKFLSDACSLFVCLFNR